MEGFISLKLKLDENLSRHLRLPLEKIGHEVDTVGDEGLLGHPDRVVADQA